MRKREFLAAGISLGFGFAATGARAQQNAPGNSGVQPSSVDLNYKPHRFNR